MLREMNESTVESFDFIQWGRFLRQFFNVNVLIKVFISPEN